MATNTIRPDDRSPIEPLLATVDLSQREKILVFMGKIGVDNKFIAYGDLAIALDKIFTSANKLINCVELEALQQFSRLLLRSIEKSGGSATYPLASHAKGHRNTLYGYFKIYPVISCLVEPYNDDGVDFYNSLRAILIIACMGLRKDGVRVADREWQELSTIAHEIRLAVDESGENQNSVFQVLLPCAVNATTVWDILDCIDRLRRKQKEKNKGFFKKLANLRRPALRQLTQESTSVDSYVTHNEGLLDMPSDLHIETINVISTTHTENRDVEVNKGAIPVPYERVKTDTIEDPTIPGIDTLAIYKLHKTSAWLRNAASALPWATTLFNDMERAWLVSHLMAASKVNEEKASGSLIIALSICIGKNMKEVLTLGVGNGAGEIKSDGKYFSREIPSIDNQASLLQENAVHYAPHLEKINLPLPSIITDLWSKCSLNENIGGTLGERLSSSEEIILGCAGQILKEMRSAKTRRFRIERIQPQLKYYVLAKTSDLVTAFLLFANENQAPPVATYYRSMNIGTLIDIYKEHSEQYFICESVNNA